jgi:hypothetical protein
MKCSSVHLSELKEAQKAAIEKHSRGAFNEVAEAEIALHKQLMQVNSALFWRDVKQAKRQMAQAAQVLWFALASMEMLDE